MPPSDVVLAELLPAADAEVLEYLSGTVDCLVDDGEASLEGLCDGLSELLLSYELAADEDAAAALIAKLHARLDGGATAPVPVAAEPLKRLDGAVKMEKFDSGYEADVLGGGPKDVDAYGNKVSAVAQANANWRPGSLAAGVAAAKASAAEADDDDGGGGGLAFGLVPATTAAEQRRREALEVAEAEALRERACELYLASKAAGGSRDVNVRGMILLAPNGRALLEGSETPVPLRLVEGRKYGLVGRNGTGKTTLLKAISSYEITGFPAHLKVVHVEQDPVLDAGATPLSAVLSFDLERRVLLRRHAELSAALAAPPEPPPEGETVEEAKARERGEEKGTGRLRRRLDEADALLAELGVDSADARAATILAGLQFSEAMMRAPISLLSGGWRMRVTLAAALFVPCDVLLLDEPTNHLDLPALAWLTNWLQGCASTVLIVSHDRGFLDAVVSDVIQLKHKQLHYHKGSVSTYVELLKEQYASQKRAFESQQLQRKQMQEMIDKYDPSKNSSADNKKNKRHAGVLAQAKQREKQLAKMEEEGLVADPDAKQDEATIAIAFPPPPPLKRPQLVTLQDVAFRYPAREAGGGLAAAAGPLLLRGVNLSVSLGSRIGVLGANGCGKSTLLRMMTDQLQPTAGSISVNRAARTAIFTQHFVEQLDLHQTATEFLGARFPQAKEVEIRARLGSFGIVNQMAWLQMSKLSGGQKSRVVLCAICWAEPALIFLDEPTNHLDMETVDVLAAALRSFGGAVVVVSHDAYFLEHAVDEFWSVRDRQVAVFRDLADAKRHATAASGANAAVDAD